MQILSLSALSAIVLSATGVVDAVPAVHDNLGGRAASGHHRAIARAPVPKAGSIVVPPTLRSKKRDSNKVIQKKCRLRPTSSTTIIASPTASTPLVTGTVIGDNSTATISTSSAPESTEGVQNWSDQWQLSKAHKGTSFFDGWDFWSLPDPTHGNVDYQSVGASWDQGLIGFDGQAAIMKVNTDRNVGNRKSVRIHDQYVFNINTLLIMDAEHMPTGCGTWPAFWTNGPNWPYGGEIDIVEGVHDQGHNQATLHTKNGCTAVPEDSTGQMLSANCGVESGDNSGCGYADYSSDNSFGAGFNEAKGGVYAMQWVDSGISVWFFPRGAIPADIEADHPAPWTWYKKPIAKWGASGCSPREFFNNQIAIFDTTFCGDWAGATWASSGCAAKTGYGSCSDYVSAEGDAFHEAYWKVNYVKYFTQNA